MKRNYRIYLAIIADLKEEYNCRYNMDKSDGKYFPEDYAIFLESKCGIDRNICYRFICKESIRNYFDLYSKRRVLLWNLKYKKNWKEYRGYLF